MIHNLLNNYYVLKELMSQDKYKKIKLKHKNARSVNICVITEKLEYLLY